MSFSGGYFERLLSIESDVLSQEAEQGAFSPPIDVVYTLNGVVDQQREDTARKESISEYGRFPVASLNFWGAFLKRAICIYWFTKMNSFCQCAPSSSSSASSNEWVPVFRAQPAAMNKMAFKAFFITAFSQAERDGCRASDRPGPAGLDYLDFLSVKNV